MKILITGATGFIGSHVARQLVGDGHDVHALLRPNANTARIADILSSLKIIRGDLLDSIFTIGAASFPCCVHLAWYVEPGKYLSAPQNLYHVSSSLRFARQLADGGCQRLIAAGTCFEYDTSLGTLSESSATEPGTVYAESKLALFHGLETFCRTVGMDFAWARFFYQYGPGEDPRRLVPVVINSLLRNQVANLSPGDQVRDYLHVADVASAVCAVAASKLTGPVNIGSAQPVTVRDIAVKIGELLSQPHLIALGARPAPPNDPPHIVADNTRLRQHTHWQPRYDLTEGLRQTIQWWKGHPAPN